MRSSVALLLILLAPSVGYAQTVIPFQLRHGLVYVPASINGKVVSVVLDTGTGGIVVDEQHAKAMGLRVGGSEGQVLGGGTGNQPTFSLQLRSIQFGPIHLHNMPSLAMNLSPLFADAGVPFSALLGYPLFAHHVITINYATHEIFVYPPGRAPLCRAPIAITGFTGNTPLVAARVRFPSSTESYQTHLIVDTGTIGAGAVFLGAKFLHVKPVQRLTSRKPTAAGSGTGGKVFSWHGKLAELDVGSQRFRNVPMAVSGQVKAFNTEQAQGSLGMGLWKGGSLTLDYPQRQLCIDVPSGTEAHPDSAAKPGT